MAEETAIEWRDNFQPHAVILTERTRREPIFVAATIGSARLLRIDFDLDGEHKSYIKKSLEGVQCRLAKWNGTSELSRPELLASPLAIEPLKFPNSQWLPKAIPPIFLMLDNTLFQL